MQETEDFRYKIVDRLIDTNVRFALYQLPQSDSVCLVLQTSEQAHTYTRFSELNGQKGFIIAPFSPSLKHPIVQIVGDKIVEGEEAIFEYLATLKLESNRSNLDEQELGEGLDDYIKYKRVFDTFYSNVAENNLQKLVLSRTLDVDRKSSIGQAFNRACMKYRNNFVYLCNSPESGAWLGSTPEIILSGDNGNWKADALAGTQKVTSSSTNITWDEKNIYEQGIVMKYMQNQLQKIGVSPVFDSPQTIYSGDLAHLKSEFRFQLGTVNGVGNVLDTLHPTPAVCGFPKEKAFDFILQNEEYDRAYYTGFVGFLDTEKRTDLYVNLRCMQILPNALRLYAGGGIMPESKADLEWQETDYKLQTIFSIV